MHRPLLALLFVGLLLSLLSTPLSADELRAEARVDRDVVGVGERVVLTVEVYGGGQISGPEMEDIEGFRIVNTSRSQTISIVNFDAVRSLLLQYVLVAEAEGEYVLGPFTVQSGKEIFETEPIKVTVVKGQAPAQPSPAQQPRSGEESVKVRASVDRTRVYVGEQVTYNVQFAYRVRPRDIQYTPPDHTGFWTEEIGETGPTIETIDGSRYYVVNRRTAFFPISSGRFTIGKASVRYVVADLRPFSFDPFGMTRGREGVAATDPVDIIVRQLPSEGRPAGFSGAVGNFDLDVSASAGEVRTGESLTLSVRITGRGNLKSIGDINVPEIDGFRVFAPKARESMNVQQLQVGGEKVFDLVLVPESPGEKVIPEFEFSYFDPRRESYSTLRSDPINISVLPGDSESLAGTAGASPAVQAARRDIRHIKRAEISADSLTLSKGGLVGFLMSYAPALVGIVGLIVSAQRRRSMISGKGAFKRSYKSSVQELRKARALAAQEDRLAEAAGVAARAVRVYLAALAGTSETMIDRSSIASMGRIEEVTAGDLADLLDVLDRIRFAPVGTDAREVTDLIGRAEALVKAAHAEWDR